MLGSGPAHDAGDRPCQQSGRTCHVRYLSPDRLACLQEGLLPLDGVEYHDPSGHDLPPRGTSARQCARFKPRIRLPKSFPNTKPSAGQRQVPGPGNSLQNGMANEAMNHDSIEHLEHLICSRFVCLQNRAHDSANFSYLDGSATCSATIHLLRRWMVAQETIKMAMR